MAKTTAKRIQTSRVLLYPIGVILIGVVLFILVTNYISGNPLQSNNQSALRRSSSDITATPPYVGKINQSLAEKLKTVPPDRQIEVSITITMPLRTPYPSDLAVSPGVHNTKCLAGCTTNIPVGPTSAEQTMTEEQYAEIAEKRAAMDRAYDAMVEKIVQRVADRVEAMGYKVDTRNMSSFSASLPPKAIEEIAKWDDVAAISGIIYTYPQ